MKDMNDLVRAAGLRGEMQQAPQQSAEQKKVITEQTIAFVNRVMKTILANSPAWSVSLKGTESINDYRQQLVKAFLENKITEMSQVELGLKRIRKEPTNFLPSVGQFIGWCIPTAEAIGCPDVNDAYNEACRYKYSKKSISHPCIAYALAKISMYDLSTKTETQTKPRFEKLYQKAVELFYYGDPLQEYVDRFKKQANHSLTKLADLRDDADYQKRNQEAAQKHIAAIKKKLKASKASAVKASDIEENTKTTKNKK